MSHTTLHNKIQKPQSTGKKESKNYYLFYRNINNSLSQDVLNLQEIKRPLRHKVI